MHSRLVETAALLLAFALIAPAARAQSESDFFDQKSSWFAQETVEGASKHAEAPTQTPATVTVIGRDDIELYGFRTLADVLNFASVGYFTSSDRRYDIAGGRGLFFFEDFNTRVLVMLNGHPMNEPWNNYAGLGREMLVPLDVVERVEIIYGPSSLLYGGYSLFGMINVVTKSGASMPGGRVHADAGSWSTAEVQGSWGRSGTTRGTDEQAGAPWDVLVSGGYYRTDGEDLDLPQSEVDYPATADGGNVFGGPQSGTDFERAPHAFLLARRGGLSITARTGSRERGAPLAPYQTIYGSRDEVVRDEKSFVELRWDRPLAKGVHLSTRLFRDWYSYLEKDPYFDDETYDGIDRYSFVLDADDRDSGGEVRITAQRGAHLLTGGVEYRTRDIHQVSYNRFLDGTRDEDSVIHDTTNGNLTVVYLQEEWRPSDRWTLVAGGNYADTEPGGQKAQPRLAAIFHPREDVAVKALYGRGFRPPSAYEAGYTDYIDYIGNPALQSEEITSTELSVMWQRSNVALQAYAFDSKLEGLIRATEILDVTDVEGGVIPPSGDAEELVGLLQYQSAGDVKSHGYGASARARRGTLRGYVNAAYATARFTPNGAESFALPASANWISSAGVAWDAGDYAVSLSGRYMSGQQPDPDREDPSATAGSFFEANSRLLWRTRMVYPVTLYLDVRNLFDSDGATATSSNVYTPSRAPIEGRRLLLGAEVRF